MTLKILLHPMSWNSLTPQEHDRIAALGIDVPLFEFFREKFVPNGFDFNLDHGNGWRACSERHLSNMDLIGHLAGDVVVAVRCGRDPQTKHYVTDQFTIDLDEGPDQWDRLDRVIRAFGVPLLFRSSDSDGMHARYFLEESIELWSLLNPQTRDGIVPRLLLEVGLELRPGFVEMLPEGTYQECTSGNALRLPCGRGSRLLDAYERMPMTAGGPIADLRLLHRLFSDGKIEPLSVPELAERARRVRRKRPKAAADVLPSKMSDGHRRQLVDQLLTRGLTGAGQFHQALYTLSVDFALRRVSKEDAACLLRRWIEGRTNGYSRTFQQDPQIAFREAEDVLARVYDGWVERASWAPRPGLTRLDAAWIVAATFAPRMLVDPETGETFERGKLQQFMRDVLDGMKQWVLTRSLRIAETIAARNPHLKIGSTKFDALFVEAAQPFWPFPPLPLFIVENPYAFRSRVYAVSERTVGALWRIAKETRLFIPYSPACSYTHKAESFAVMLDFSTAGSNEPTTLSLGAGVIQLLPPSAIREQYSKHYARKVRVEGIAELRSHFAPDAPERDVKSYVQMRLWGACARCAEAASGLSSHRVDDRSRIEACFPVRPAPELTFRSTLHRSASRPSSRSRLHKA